MNNRSEINGIDGGPVAQTVRAADHNLKVKGSSPFRSTIYVGLSEWLGKGLQNLVREFDSHTLLDFVSVPW